MLQLKNITKIYSTSSEQVHALRGVSISFRKTEFVSILGPSGCGKTTLLNIIGGLDHYTDGDLMISERSTKSFGDREWDVYRNHKVGFIFQSYNLIPHQTVLGNVELALTISGISREERIRRAKEALDRVGLSDQYYKRPNQLSGGQCQRVAIARALVNDPEILLADEPTGALDTVTSVQIMDLVKEISKERLVIMVTHNPELAEEYSTRIVRLLDGNVIEDTNPMTDAEIEAEALENKAAKEKEEAIFAALDKKSEKRARREKRRREGKAKMSFFTAFKLSLRNLISKKGRTTMVGIAGSIGIVGIAMVLAFSAGIKGYIASMQDDMLSGNPIMISENAYDLTALTDMMENMTNTGAGEKDEGYVYVASLIEYLATMKTGLQNIMLKNDITEEYMEYIKAMPSEYYNAIIYDYGIDMTVNIYTDFNKNSTSDPERISLHRLLNVAKSVLSKTQIKDQAESITSLAPSFAEMPNNPDYILSQYELVGEGSKIATEAGEIMLVLDANDELSDILLARLGYFTQEEVLELVHKANGDEYNEALYKNRFSYEELLGREFVWYPNDTIFTRNEPAFPGMPETYSYNSSAEGFSDEGAVPLKVVGILTPKDTVLYGSLTSGIYYTEALTEHVLAANADSNIAEYLLSDDAATVLAMTAYNLIYTYSYEYDGVIYDGTDGNMPGTGMIGPALTMEEMLAFAVNPDDALANLDKDDMTARFIRALGGNDTASGAKIYPISFDDKILVTDYLDLWNEDGNITVGDVTLTADDRDEINYTDALELVISLINTMIDVVSYALIAFTSVSLVVSTVMIGIITYVSVVERIKEIGVIRSLGGRKKDVSHLFNAETFIIGLLAGLIGVGFTYLVSIPVNLILAPIINYSSIAALPISNAVLLVCLSIVLTLISGLIPAKSAANKDPVVALRTE